MDTTMTEPLHVWDDLDLSTLEARVKSALEAAMWASVDGAHHKQWVIDQMVRMLTGCPEVLTVNQSAHPEPIEVMVLGESDEYRAWVRDFNQEDERDEDGEPMYAPWDVGIAP